MAHWKIISISALMACFIWVQTSKADKYEVLYTNSKNIKINGKKVYVGLQFDDKDMSSIVWTSENQAISVLNLRTKRMLVIPAKRYKEKKAESLLDYINKVFKYNVKHMSTRGYEQSYNDTIYYLLDTLRISAGIISNSSLSNEVILKINGETIITPIKKSTDNKDFILTRQIWGTKHPQPTYIDIIETDKQRNWTYFIYKKLYIVPLLLNVD